MNFLFKTSISYFAKIGNSSYQIGKFWLETGNLVFVFFTHKRKTMEVIPMTDSL